MAYTVAYDPNTGQPLAQGQTVTFEGRTYTGGSTDIYGTSPTPTASPTMQVTQGTTGPQGVVNYDPNTGSQLTQGQTVAINPGNSTYGAVPIQASTLQNQTPLPITSPTPTNNADVLAAGATQQSTQLNSDITAAKTAQSTTQGQYDQLSSEISNLLGTTVGRGQATLDAEKAAGVPGLQQNLTDINNQIQTKLAEFNKIQAQYAQATQVQEGKSIPMNLIIGREAEINKSLAVQKNSYAADIGLLQAQASAIQGNLTLAKETADRAVDLKYEDATTLLNVKMQQLNLIRDKLSAQQKTTADLLDRQYQAQRDQLSITIANQKDQNATILNLIQANPGAGITLQDSVTQAAAKAAAYQAAHGTTSNTPTSIQEYQYAVSQGYTGTYTQYQDRNRTSSTSSGGTAATTTNGVKLSNAQEEKLVASGQFTQSQVNGIYNYLLQGGDINNITGISTTQKQILTTTMGIKPPTTSTGIIGGIENFFGSLWGGLTGQ